MHDDHVLSSMHACMYVCMIRSIACMHVCTWYACMLGGTQSTQRGHGRGHSGESSSKCMRMPDNDARSIYTGDVV